MQQDSIQPQQPADPTQTLNPDQVLHKPVIIHPDAVQHIAPPTPPPEYDLWMHQASATSGVPYPILRSVIFKESGYHADAHNPSGATGLGQFMPGTARGLGIDPKNPQQSINGAAKYLMDQYGQFKKWDLAVAAYNAGPGNVERFKGIPPFHETQDYVSSVIGMAHALDQNISANIDILHNAMPKSLTDQQKNLLTKLLSRVPNHRSQQPYQVRYAGIDFNPMEADAATGGEHDPTSPVDVGANTTFHALDVASAAASTAFWGPQNIGERGMRDAVLGNRNPASEFAPLWTILNDPTMSIAQKTMNIANNFDFNSTGDVGDWAASPGVRTGLQMAHLNPRNPYDALRAVYIVNFGIRSDYARLKPHIPWITAGQSFASTMANPIFLAKWENLLPSAIRGSLGEAAAGVSRSANEHNWAMIGDRFQATGYGAQNPHEAVNWHMGMLYDSVEAKDAVRQMVESPEHFGGLGLGEDQQNLVQLLEHPERAGLAERVHQVAFPTGHGLPIMERAENIRAYTESMENRLVDLVPSAKDDLLSRKRFAGSEAGKQPQAPGMATSPEFPAGGEEGRSMYVPRATFWNVQLELGGAGGRQFSNTGITNKSRVFPTAEEGLHQAHNAADNYEAHAYKTYLKENVRDNMSPTDYQRVQKAARDFAGKQRTQFMGQVINQGWTVASDYTPYAENLSTYIKMHEAVNAGRNVLDESGKPYVIDMTYKWVPPRWVPKTDDVLLEFPRGSQNLIDLGLPRDLENRAERDEFVQQVKLHMEKLARPGYPYSNPTQVLNELTESTFRKEYPGHVELHEPLHTPHLKGVAGNARAVHALRDSFIIDREARFHEMQSKIAREKMMPAEALWQGRTGAKMTQQLDDAQQQAMHEFMGNAPSTPEMDDMLKYHFGNTYDDPLEHANRFLSRLAIWQRAAIVTGLTYHTFVNVVTSALHDIVERSGYDPVKITKGFGLMMQALGVGMAHTVPAVSSSMREAVSYLGAGIGGKKGMGGGGWQSGDWIPSARTQKVEMWLNSAHLPAGVMEKAQKDRVLSPKMSGSYLPPREYGKVFSLPWEGLSTSEKLNRAVVGLTKANRDFVFGKQTPLIEAMHYHILTEHLGVPEQEAADAVRRTTAGDPMNLTAKERAGWLHASTLFYGFARAKIREAWSNLKRPRTLLAANKAVRTLNDMQGAPNVGGAQMVLANDGQGNMTLMPAAFAPYRYAYRLADVLFGVPITGDIKPTLQSTASLTAGELTAMPALAARGVASMIASRGPSTGPEPFNNLSPLFDPKLNLGQQAQQAGESAAGMFMPSAARSFDVGNISQVGPVGAMGGLGPPVYQKNKAWSVAQKLSDQMWKINEHNPAGYPAAQELLFRLEKGDTSAIQEATALVKQYQYPPKRKSFSVLPKTGGLGGLP